ncbi:glycosyltransferase [Cytobacillus sp.]|uniref:CgeB family protein n=1 Tax=Cytobacillus sp. TaxID=2675269 RepID=UPI003514B9B0
MDIQLIEKQLARIADRKKKLQFELDSLEAPHPVKLKKLSNSEWWYRAQSQTTLEKIPGGLFAEIPDSQHLYFSYRENNVDFSRPPQFPLVQLENGEHNIHFLGEATGSLTAALYLIGYQNSRKTNMKKISLGSAGQIRIDNGESVRIALKIKGSGSLDIKELRIGDIVIPFMAEEQIEADQDRFVSFPEYDLGKKLHFSGSEIFAAPIDEKYISKNEQEMVIHLPEQRYAALSLGNGHQPSERCPETQHHQSINAESCYEVFFQTQTAGRLEKELIIVGYDHEQPIDVKCIQENRLKKIKLSDQTADIRFFLRVKGAGTIAGCSIHLQEKPKVPLAVTEVSLDKNSWFAPPPSKSEFINDGNKLTLISDRESSQTKYVSYGIKNISFKLVPESSTFTITENSYYELEIDADKAGSGLAVPILVTYSDDEKKDIIPLQLNEKNIIKFKSGITKCRIACKLSGPNKITFSRFTIKQFEEEQTGGDMVWVKPKEVENFGLVPKKDLEQIKMAVIFDEFTTECFANECELISFTPGNWKHVLSANVPDLLMVESAWRGNGGAWTKKVQFTSEEAVEDLKELINWCNEHGVPTVFWNKEDPVHFNHFIKTAELFDYIFTTDANSVQSYKDACGHDRVDCLPFAAQPKIHNPLTIGPRENAASFAGSFYAKHVERSESMLRIFKEAIPYGLAIYDRNYDKVQQGLLKNNRFPDHLQPYIKGSLKYYEIDKSYKGYKVMINVNTVQHSPTMFARRVYEGLASGTPIISTHSDGVKALFGDLVCVSEDEAEIAEAFRILFEDEQEYRRIAREGINRVLASHTYLDRLEKISLSLNLPFSRRDLEILVYARAGNESEAASIVESFTKQKWKNKRLVLLLENDTHKSIYIDNPSIEAWDLKEYLRKYQNLLMEEKEFDYIALLSPYENHTEDFLSHLALTSSYAPWEIIGEHDSQELFYGQVPSIRPLRGLFKRELFSSLSSRVALELMETNSIELFKARGARVMGIPGK